MGPVLFPQVADVFILQRGCDRTFPNDVARRIELQETLAARWGKCLTSVAKGRCQMTHWSGWI